MNHITNEQFDDMFFLVALGRQVNDVSREYGVDRRWVGQAKNRAKKGHYVMPSYALPDYRQRVVKAT